MNKNQKIAVAALAVLLVGSVGYFGFLRDKLRSKNVKQISLTAPSQEDNSLKNEGPVSPISGIACDNWNKRPIAVMQPADRTARPAAGFSDADMMFEMPVFTNANTRLMGVYICNVPNEIGSIRSARHDYIPLAKGLDAVFVHWGYSRFAQTLLEQKVIDNINCLTTSYCDRWPKTGIMNLEDTGHITKEKIAEAMQKYGYDTKDNFSGYPHQEEASLDQRSASGHLRIAFPKGYDVSYDYDKNTNTYLRTWADAPDTDKNNGKRVAPKNIVVMTAESEQIKLSTDYKARGVQDPWQLVPEEDRAGLNDIPGAPGIGRYNNLQIGDPWFDTSDSGKALYYMNGKQYEGTWKKDKSKIDSKLFFYDSSGQEIKFVPGQIWVEVVEPGYNVRWSEGL